jgi:phenylalanyl-tRNA synthetase beta chain
VSETTTNVLLESAYFDPKVVRKGAKNLGISTEASQHFERGADYNATVKALDRAAGLIAEIGGGTVIPGVIDAYSKKQTAPILKLRTKRVEQVLGVGISRQQTAETLRSLECEVSDDNGALVVKPPSFRPDLTREIDLIEEVARIFGYDRIPTADRASGGLGVEELPQHLLVEHVRELLMASGLTEVVTSSLADPEALRTVESDIEPISLSNPASREMSALRSTLVSSLLEVVCWNLNRKAQTVKIFEVGKVFFPAKDSTAKERLQIGGALTGQRRKQHWEEKDCQVDFFDIKGILQTVLGETISDRLTVKALCCPCYQEGKTAQLLLNNDILGTFGRVAPQVLTRFQIKQPVYIFTLEFDSLLRHWQREKKFRPLPRYPAAQRDISVVVDEQVETEQIVQTIEAVDPRLIESVELFDTYKGNQIPRGKKSLAFSLIFRSLEATLSEAKVERFFQKIVNRLYRKEINYGIRSLKPFRDKDQRISRVKPTLVDGKQGYPPTKRRVTGVFGKM